MKWWMLTKLAVAIILQYAAAAAKSLQSCLTLCNPIRQQPTRLCRPWDSPGKNTGVGCHFLLQCVKVKSESEVAQSCPTLSDPTDCSLPGFSIHGIFQARVMEWGAIAFSGATVHGVTKSQIKLKATNTTTTENKGLNIFLLINYTLLYSGYYR